MGEALGIDPRDTGSLKKNMIRITQIELNDKGRGRMMKNPMGQGVWRLVAATIVVFAAILLLTVDVPAQGYPSRDITFINPFAPGGSTDPLSRQFCMQLEKILGANINVENKPGGSGTIGATAVVRAKPDGYTIGYGSNSILAYQPLVNPSLIYKTADDYQPIVKMIDQYANLSVRADAPWKNFDEFLADVRKNPGKIRASNSSLGGNSDWVTKQFNKAANVKITTVPLSGGGGEALVALLAGRVEAFAGYPSGVLGNVKAGKIRVLAVFRKGKDELFPDAVSVADIGYNATLASAGYVFGPKGMPKDVLAKLADASLKVVRSEEFRKLSLMEGFVVDAKGPEETRAEIFQQVKVYTELMEYVKQQ